MRVRLAILLVAAAALAVALVPGASADRPAVTTTPIDESISLRQTTLELSIPEENNLVWGYVRGGPSEYVERYPVIIQFFQEDEPVHVAQVDVRGDGSYDYKFRIKNVDLDTGETLDIFSGDYTVKIFRVVPNPDTAA